MRITDIVLVTENWKGTEKNSLMTVEDYLKYLDLDKFDNRKDLAVIMDSEFGERVTELVLCMCRVICMKMHTDSLS